MSPAHLLKDGATARTHIRVNLLCADKRLTCGSYPSACIYCTVHLIRHSVCHSHAHPGSLQPTFTPWGAAPPHLALHPLLGHIPFRRRRFWVLRCLDPLQGGLTSWLPIPPGVGVYLFEGGGGNVSPGMATGLQLQMWNRKELWRPWPWLWYYNTDGRKITIIIIMCMFCPLHFVWHCDNFAK